MKNQRITIPENTRVIIDGGVIIFESKAKTISPLNIGKWYSSALNQFNLVLDGSYHSCGFYKGEWFDRDESMMINNGSWYPADMEEVKRLLIERLRRGDLKKELILSLQ